MALVFFSIVSNPVFKSCMLSECRSRNSEFTVMLINLCFEVRWVYWITNRVSSVLVVNFVSNITWVQFDPESCELATVLDIRSCVRNHYGCETGKLGSARTFLFLNRESSFWSRIGWAYFWSYLYTFKGLFYSELHELAVSLRAGCHGIATYGIGYTRLSVPPNKECMCSRSWNSVTKCWWSCDLSRFAGQCSQSLLPTREMPRNLPRATNFSIRSQNEWVQFVCKLCERVSNVVVVNFV